MTATQYTEAEATVLGAIMLENGALQAVSRILSPEDFYLGKHSVIFQAMIELGSDAPIDVITLTDVLRRRGEIDRVGGSYYLTSLVDSVPTAQNVMAYAEIVQKQSYRRRLHEASSQLAECTQEPGGDLEAALSRVINFASDYNHRGSEAKLEVNAEVLRREPSHNALQFLPVLGREGYFVKGWAHMVAGYPKTGKTELLIRIIGGWTDLQVLYFTEEPQSLWRARLEKFPEVYRLGHVTLYYALGNKPSDIHNRIMSGHEQIVVIDTVRNLLSIIDEKDNSEVVRAIKPFVSACHKQGKTLIFCHHDRKGGGENGEGIAGGHAFMGIVDVALELKRDGKDDSRRRLLRGWGRVIEIPPLLLELTPDGELQALGSPRELALENVMRRIAEVLEPNWLRTSEIKRDLDEPKPSDDQLIRALEALANKGSAERQPPMSDGKRQGAVYKWRLRPNPTSDTRSYTSEAKSEAETAEWEDVS